MIPLYFNCIYQHSLGIRLALKKNYILVIFVLFLLILVRVKVKLKISNPSNILLYKISENFSPYNPNLFVNFFVYPNPLVSFPLLNNKDQIFFYINLTDDTVVIYINNYKI